MIEHKKMYFIFKESLEEDAGKLFSFLKKSCIKKYVFPMIGCNKKPLTAYQIFRVRYAYCAYRMIIEEFGSDFTLNWFARPNMFLEQKTPIFALRHYEPEKLPRLTQVAMMCIQAGNGILP